MLEWDVIVIGAGAAGLFVRLKRASAGVESWSWNTPKRSAKRSEFRAAVVATSPIFGQAPITFVSANPHFCKSALARYTPADFISLVEKHGIAYHEKKLGQLFCDGSSQQIIDMLLRECLAAGVEIRCHCQVLKVSKADDAGQFSITTNQGMFACSSLGHRHRRIVYRAAGSD